ncbi:MAG: stage II sporulation protein R [Oscillospiraceae bacterium]|nr:stage II sporulation protein R [Oscillospiraceae bacterium]
MRRVGFCFLLAALVWCGTLLADRELLNEELIRLHVVANSDSEEDQAIKLRVRDAVTESLREAMEDVADVEEAKAYLQENLPKIQKVANDTLRSLGCTEEAVVTLCRQAFDTRYYDTFTLPAGVYDALRITIGAGEGQNWWCVVFPTFCIPATTEGFEDVAAGAGFPDALNEALTGEQEVRFFFLDALGKLENLFFME